MTDDIASRSLSERVVALCVADLERRGETPVHTGRVVRETSDRLGSVDAETLGKLSEAEVTRALNRLEADGVVEMHDPDDRSPTGKGRPSYSQSIQTGTVLDALSDDDDVGRLVDRIGDETV